MNKNNNNSVLILLLLAVAIVVVSLLFFQGYLRLQGESSSSKVLSTGDDDTCVFDVMDKSVPDKYYEVYAELESILSRYDSDGFDADGFDADGRIFHSMVNPFTNSNHFETLITERNLELAKKLTEEAAKLGYEAITFEVQSPILTQSFYTNQYVINPYIEFYQEISTYAKSLDLLVIVDSQVTSTTVDGELLRAYQETLDKEEYIRTRKDTLTNIVRIIQPDLLVVANDQYSEYLVSGQEFINRDNEYIKYVLDLAKLAKSSSNDDIKIGAGFRISQANYLELAQSYVESKDIDYVALNIYSINSGQLDRIAEVDTVVGKSNKELAIGEMWLYKIRTNEVPISQDLYSYSEISARDALSFWSPLDVKFLNYMNAYASAHSYLYTSAYWTKFLYTSLDYNQNKQKSDKAIIQSSDDSFIVNIEDSLKSELGCKYFEIVSPL